MAEKKHYKIGITFRSSLREKFVLPLCQDLLKHGFTKDDIFYDEWHRDDWNGEDSFIDIYGHRCDFVVVVLSSDYQDDYWTGKVEWTAVRELITNYETNERVYILDLDNVSESSDLFTDSDKNKIKAMTIAVNRENDSTDDIIKKVLVRYENAVAFPEKMTQYILSDSRNADKILNEENDRADEYDNIINRYLNNDEEIPYSWINYGYWLTDVYDHSDKYDKALKLTNKLFSIINGQDISRRISVYHSIKYSIGLYYTLAIAKIKDKNVRIKNIAEAERVYQNYGIEQKIENSNISQIRKYDLLGQYYSDYAAVMLNKGDILPENIRDQRIPIYEWALDYHKLGLKVREQYCKLAVSPQDVNDSRVGKLKSISNIGSTYYRLGRFKEAIDIHKLYLSQSSREDRQYAVSETYILGAYVEKWNKDRYINAEEEKEFIYYLKDGRELAADSPKLLHDIDVCEEKYYELKEELSTNNDGME